MPTLKYPKNPNIETAFVEQDDGTKNRVVMTAPQDISTLEYPSNPNSTKGYVTVDGKKQRVIMVADIVGGGGSSLPDQTGHSGEFLTTDGTDASWAAVDSLPDQTGQSGKFLTTDGTDASWSDKPLQNTATGTNSLTVGGTSTNNDFATNIGINSNPGFEGVAIGYGVNMAVTGGVAIGAYASSSHLNDSRSIAIGYKAKVGAWGAIQLSTAVNAETNSDANTFKVANYNGNFEIMSADGTIPKARLANVATVPATTPTLVVADWSSNTQTITVTGVTASNVVLVSPAPSSASDYASAGIICTAQGTDSLTFTCDTVPTNAIDLSVVIL